MNIDRRIIFKRVISHSYDLVYMNFIQLYYTRFKLRFWNSTVLICPYIFLILLSCVQLGCAWGFASTKGYDRVSVYFSWIEGAQKGNTRQQRCVCEWNVLYSLLKQWHIHNLGILTIWLIDQALSMMREKRQNQNQINATQISRVSVTCVVDSRLGQLIVARKSPAIKYNHLCTSCATVYLLLFLTFSCTWCKLFYASE